jgi:uncharacterized protein YdeI (YjbR/CyaY-like superfamily)
MGKKDIRIDHYIDGAKEFAQPILIHLRELIHKACPEVVETIKWGMPSFDYKGPYCGMASFKQHCVFGFWKAKLLEDPNHYLKERANEGGEAMYQLGRITSLDDLPPDKAIIDFLKQAKRLNDEGIKVPTEPKKKKEELLMPDDLIEELRKNKKAMATYEGFSATNKREYIEWINEAKTEATRNKRLQTALEWIAEGKIKNWKYIKK